MNEYLEILGYEVRDCVTGFEGVAASVTFDLYGCVQVIVTPPQGEDGKLPDGAWFDYKRLEKTSKSRVMQPQEFTAPPLQERGAERHSMPPQKPLP